MRSIILVLIILGSMPVCLVNPYFGVLMWYWVSYFNPHRFTYGFSYNMPVAFLVAIPTLVGLIFTKKSLRSLLTAEVCTPGWPSWAWYSITYIYAKGVPIFIGHMAKADSNESHQ